VGAGAALAPGVIPSYNARTASPSRTTGLVSGVCAKGSDSMPKVTFVNEKVEIEVPQGANLRSEAKKAGIELYPFPHKYLNCLGFGMCGTCRVLVKAGMENLNPKTTVEKLNLTLHPLTALAVIGHENEMRLSCQVQVNGDCSVETKPSLNLSGVNFWQKPYPNK
jgi:ferredoxin